MTDTDKQFQLEQAILRCWDVCEDLGDLIALIEKEGCSAEQIATMLATFRTLYQFRFDHAFGLFEDLSQQHYQLRSQHSQMASRIADFELIQSRNSAEINSKRAKRD